MLKLFLSLHFLNLGHLAQSLESATSRHEMDWKTPLKHLVHCFQMTGGQHWNRPVPEHLHCKGKRVWFECGWPDILLLYWNQLHSISSHSLLYLKWRRTIFCTIFLTLNRLVFIRLSLYWVGVIIESICSTKTQSRTLHKKNWILANSPNSKTNFPVSSSG